MPWHEVICHDLHTSEDSLGSKASAKAKAIRFLLAPRAYNSPYSKHGGQIQWCRRGRICGGDIESKPSQKAIRLSSLPCVRHSLKILFIVRIHHKWIPRPWWGFYITNPSPTPPPPLPSSSSALVTDFPRSSLPWSIMSRDALVVGNVVGDVLDPFVKSATMKITYNKELTNGSELKPSMVATEPRVEIRGHTTRNLYTLVSITSTWSFPSCLIINNEMCRKKRPKVWSHDSDPTSI